MNHPALMMALTRTRIDDLRRGAGRGAREPSRGGPASCPSGSSTGRGANRSATTSSAVDPPHDGLTDASP